MDSGGDNMGAMFELREKNEMRDAALAGQANVQEAWATLRMLREVLEQACPPGTIPNGEYLEPSITVEGEALLKGILVLINAVKKG